MKYRPVGERIIVQCENETTVSNGGIVMPQSAIKRLKQGIVKAVGRGKVLRNGKTLEMVAKVGDKVVFKSFAGYPITDDKNTLVMEQSDIIAIVKE